MKYYSIVVLLLLISCSSRPEIDEESYQLVLKSDTALMERNLNEALSLVNKAIEIDKNNYIAYNNLGYVKLFLDYPNNEVLEAFKKSYDLNNDYLVGLYSLTNCYFEYKDYKNTIKFGSRYLDKISNKGNLLVQESQILAVIGESYNYLLEYSKAEEYLTKSIQIEPNIATRYKERGIARKNLGNEVNALNDFNKAIFLDSLYHQAYNSIAIYFEKLEMAEEALINYNKAIDLEPNSSIYLLNRAKFLIEKGNIEQACLDIEKSDSLGNKEAKEYREKYCN